MIRNLIVLEKNGQALLSSNFGECHSFGDSSKMVSGFISAVHSFAQMLSADFVDEIQLGGLYFMLMFRGDLIFAISADDEDTEGHRDVLNQIVDLFAGRYGSVLPDSEEPIDVAPFEKFPQFLIDNGVVENNCGKHENCTDCENHEKSLPLVDMKEQLVKEEGGRA